jgi:hypothetical protein
MPRGRHRAVPISQFAARRDLDAAARGRASISASVIAAAAGGSFARFAA